MKRLLFFVSAVLFATFLYSQERLLTMKIVYEVPIMQGRIASSETKDSIVYDYLVDKRFWWQTIDRVNALAKNKKLFFTTFKGDSIVYDSIMSSLTLALNKQYGKTHTPQEVQKIIEEQIRAVRFEEQWHYDENNMLIAKRVLAFNPVIIRDTIAFEQDELKIKPLFRYELGWVRPRGEVLYKDTVVVARNIEFTIPIYNSQPYHWWDSHLEAEYSVPFLESLNDRAENGHIKVYEAPSSSEEFIKPEILKRKQFDVLETLVSTDQYGNVSERDTVIKSSYTSDNIDHFRFGEEWYFDKENLNFIKNTNYFAPMVSIFGKQGDFRGLYPLYYIRRR